MRIARYGLLVGLLIALLPVGAAARQSPEEQRAATRARAQAELDQLMPLFTDAQARWSAANALRVQAERTKVVNGTDTIRVGPFRVIVLAGQGDEARPYFESAWARYSPMLDGMVPRKLSEQLFAFQYGLILKEWDLPSSATRIERTWDRPSEVQRIVDRAVASVLSQSLPPAQKDWAGPMVGLEPDMESVHRELILGVEPPESLSCLRSLGCPAAMTRLSRHAFSDSPVLVGCRDGEVGSCWIAMGANGHRHLIDDIRLWHGDELFRLLTVSSSRCANTLGVERCERLLTQSLDDLSPLGDLSRASLVSVALDMGGRGSLQRFIEAASWPVGNAEREPADYAGILSATSATDSDELMSEWLRRVQAAKPDRAGTDKEARFSAYLWILLFIALATRSTRWRLG